MWSPKFWIWYVLWQSHYHVWWNKDCQNACTLCAAITNRTWKLSYCKDDRVMRQYGCHEKFSRVLTTPTATFPEICNGLLFRSILRLCVQNLKFIALPVTRSWDNRRYWKNFGSPGYAHAPFSPKFLVGFCSDGPCECTCQIWSS